MDTKVVEGVGFGVSGYEEDYIVLIKEDGDYDYVPGTSLLPREAKVEWAHYEALTGGFGKESGAEVLESRRLGGVPKPRAVKVRIQIETELLSLEETDRLLNLVKANKANNALNDEDEA